MMIKGAGLQLHIQTIRAAFYLPFIQAVRAGESDDKDKDGTKNEQDSDKDGEEKDDTEQDSDSDKNKDSDKDKSELTRARNEAAKFRTDLRNNQKELAKLQKQLKDIDDKDKSDVEKLREEVAQLKKDNQTLSSKAVIADIIPVAVRANAYDPADVARLIDSESEDSIDEQIKSLKEKKSYLFRSNGSSDGGRGKEKDKEKKSDPMNDLIRGK